MCFLNLKGGRGGDLNPSIYLVRLITKLHTIPNQPGEGGGLFYLGAVLSLFIHLINLSIYLHIYSSINAIYLVPIYVIHNLYLSIYLSLFLTIYSSTHLFIYLYNYLFIYLFLFIYQYIYRVTQEFFSKN